MYVSIMERKGIEKGIQLGRAEGEARGIQLGRAEGRAEGEARGIQLGRAEGRAECVEETAAALLRENVDILLVSRVTGLSTERLMELQTPTS